METHRKHIIFEVCIDAPDALSVCRAAGVERVELCSALSVGGLTPSPGLMQMAARSGIPAHAMIRPVDGGFVLSDPVMQTMLADIAAARSYGLAGIVVGVLTADGQIDAPRMTAFVQAAGPMEVTLHRAVDLCVDPVGAVDVAVDLGITRILTSGAAKTAWDGRDVIAQMVDRAAGRITIMAGSGVNAGNVAELVHVTGVRDVHGSCAVDVLEADRVSAFGFGPAMRRQTDAGAIREILDRL